MRRRRIDWLTLKKIRTEKVILPGPGKPKKYNPTIFLASGKKISLIDKREVLIKLYSWRGIGKDKWRRLLKKQAVQFRQLSRVVDWWRQGLSIVKIAETEGKTEKTIRSWLTGKQLPDLLSPAVALSHIEHRKPLNISMIVKDERNSPDVAYILGTRMGNASTYVSEKGLRSMFSMAVNSKQFANELLGRIKRLLNGRGKLRERKMNNGAYSYEVQLPSAEIVQFVNKETLYGDRVPARFLKTMESKIEFAKALFDSNGFWKTAKNRKTISIYFSTHNEALRNYLSSQVLSQLGISHSNVEIKGRPAIYIKASGVRSFNRLIGFRK